MRHVACMMTLNVVLLYVSLYTTLGSGVFFPVQEFVAESDYASDSIFSNQFLIAQGEEVSLDIIHQDNNIQIFYCPVDDMIADIW